MDDLRRLFDRQVRAWLPKRPPIGAAIERDGPVTRTHYGTHGTVTHADLPADGLDELVSRQVRAFAGRREPAEWKVYGHGTPRDLGDRLVARSFTEGWRREVFAAAVAEVRADHEPPGAVTEKYAEDVMDLAATAGPHRVPLAELVTDGRVPHWQLHIAAVTHEDREVAAGWVDLLDGTDFAAIGGMTAPHPALLANLCAWARDRGRRTHVVAEADGELAETLTAAGFLPITAVTSYHLRSPEPPATERPVVEAHRQEYQPIWDRVYADLRFRPGVRSMPAVAEPDTSVTWRLDALNRDEQAIDELQRIVVRGLRACVAPDETLYWLDWNHPAYRFEPGRVGGPGQPPWPGAAYPDGDYYLYVTPDLRLGTFGHPWEHSLCVFGDLLGPVERDLTELLGAALRRGGR